MPTPVVPNALAADQIHKGHVINPFEDVQRELLRMYTRAKTFDQLAVKTRGSRRSGVGWTMHVPASCRKGS